RRGSGRRHRARLDPERPALVHGPSLRVGAPVRGLLRHGGAGRSHPDWSFGAVHRRLGRGEPGPSSVGGYRIPPSGAAGGGGGGRAYGIPEYWRRQQAIDREVARLGALGVEFRTGVRVGRDLSLDELLQTYDAVFVGTGANEPATLGIPGEELEGVWTAKEFL